jgi:hypothetical protein
MPLSLVHLAFLYNEAGDHRARPRPRSAGRSRSTRLPTTWQRWLGRI